MHSQNRLRELDFLRGIAIILVIFRHKEVIHFIQVMGWIGVDLFFVLSGFLVSGLLFKEYKKYGSIDAKLFLIRRGFKIYPVFYLTYILYIIPRIILNKPDLKYIIFDLTFTQNYFLGWGYAYAQSWSLAVEEHFYFGLALFLWLIFNKKVFQFKVVENGISKFEVFLIFILITVLILRVISNIQFPDEKVRNTTMSHLRMDSLLFGVLISYWYYFRIDKLTFFYLSNKFKLLTLSFLMLLFTPFIDQLDSFFVKTIGFTIIYLSFGILLIHFLIDKNINNQLDNLFSIKLVNFISKIGVCSYSIYIIHTLVIFAVKFLPINNKIITFILVFVISIYAGFLITSKVENYFLDLRDKYYPKRL